nr:hypothetical protein [Streptomyces sp. YIM 98790]
MQVGQVRGWAGVIQVLSRVALPSAGSSRRILRIERTWPWAAAFTTSWNRLTRLPAAT